MRSLGVRRQIDILAIEYDPFAVWRRHRSADALEFHHESSRVRFHPLSNSAIESYLAKVGPLDKAGAYAAQGSGAEIIAKIEGSFTNVVGLPMEKTVAELAKFRVRPKAA